MTEPLIPVDPDEQPPKSPEPVATVPADAEPEGTVVNPQGEKLVPLAALQAERQKAKEAVRLAHENQELRQQAARAQQLETHLQQALPYIEALKARPDLLSQLAGGLTVPDAQKVIADQEATDLARTLELYTPDGQPDSGRAHKLASLMDARADARARAVVAPVMQTSAQQISAQWFERVAALHDAHGRSVNRETLKQIWNYVPAEVLVSDPRIAEMLYYAAKGVDEHRHPSSPAPEHEPLVTEPSGGRLPTAPPIPEDLLHRSARALDVDPTRLRQRIATFKPGVPNVLED